MTGWPNRGRASQRKGAKRLPEKQRQRILRRYPHCWLSIPGICTGKSQEVHHVVSAADFDDPNDPAIDSDDQLVGVCKACHRIYSARDSQQRAVKAAWDWKRKPERHPGVLPD